MATAHRDWHRRLTVIDDSPAMLELLGDVLRGDGAEIRLLDSDVTLQDLEGPVPDLLMIDLRLGGDRLREIYLLSDTRGLREVRARLRGHRCLEIDHLALWL